MGSPEADVRIKNNFFSKGERENHHKIPLIINQMKKRIIMIMVKISAWGSPNLQYLDMGVAGEKGLETLP